MFMAHVTMYPDILTESHVLSEVINRAVKYILDLPREYRHKSVLIYQHRGEHGHNGWYFERSRNVVIVSYDFEKDITHLDWHTDRKSAERYELRYCLDD